MKTEANKAAAPAVDTAEDFDLAALDTSEASDKGAEIEWKHPINGKPLGIFVGVLGKHSQVFKEIVRDRANKRVQKEAFAARRNKHLDPRTAEQVEAEAIELLVACTTHWFTVKRDDKGNEISRVETIRFKGEDLAHNVPNATRVLTGLIWAREQTDAAIGDLENFIKA
jgi:hypothetical protein